MMIYSWQQYSGTFTNPAAYSISFGYDPQGNRWKQAITESGTTETRTFLYDREDILAEYTDELLTERKAMYIHGPGIDETLALVSPECEVYVFLHDGLVGSVTGLVDFKGQFVNDYDYAAFGQWSVSSGRETIENRFMYTNREYVESGPNDTELYYYRARYYRPDLGRFISMDPLGMVDGTNQFGYVQSNPVIKKDPTGSAGMGSGCACWKKVYDAAHELRSQRNQRGNPPDLPDHHCYYSCLLMTYCKNWGEKDTRTSGVIAEHIDGVRFCFGSGMGYDEDDIEGNEDGMDCGRNYNKQCSNFNPDQWCWLCCRDRQIYREPR